MFVLGRLRSTNTAVWFHEDCVLCFVHCSAHAGKYALHSRHFAKLLGADSHTADQIFDTIFDTDANGLVDAFEAM